MQKIFRALIVIDLILLALFAIRSRSVSPRPLAISSWRPQATAHGVQPSSEATTSALTALFSRTVSPVPTELPAVPTLPQATEPLPTPTLGPPPPELAATIDGYMNDLLNAQLFHGAILVARGDQVIISKGYGMADAEGGIAITPQTRFRLASLSKQFTAMAIMLLQAQGKLNVQDPICTYVADCPAAWQPITIHNLLTHTSGVPNYTDFADFDATQMQPATPAQLVGRIRELPLNFTPGTVYSYNNSGYMLLALVIEHASGQSYEAYLHDQIFAPLGMQDSGVDHNETDPSHAVGYSSFSNTAPPLDTSTLFGCGGLYSTVEDMQRWDQGLATNQLLPSAYQDQIFTPFLNDYGYGWKIQHLNGHLRISHAGLIEGFANFNARYPDDHVTVIVLSNLFSADVAGISNYVAGLVLGS